MRNNILSLLAVATLSACTSCEISRKESSTQTHQHGTTLGQAAEDLRISAAIHTDLAALDLYKPIDVKVRNGKVTYTGNVSTEKENLLALGAAWKQNGVVEVENNLIVDSTRASANAKQLAKDSWITATLKAKTLADTDIKFSNYSVHTSNGVVYLFGKARSTAEHSKVKSIAQEIDGVVNVVSHVTMPAR
jgi:osmotically-inducible protein OsmY